MHRFPLSAGGKAETIEENVRREECVQRKW